jgi:Xaa-Pro aminopeptidase
MNEDRIKRLRDYLAKEKIDGILISSVANIEYLTNFFNFSKEERDAYFFVTKKQNYLITSALYAQSFKNKRLDFKLAEISTKTRSKDILEDIKKKNKIKVLAIEEEDLKVREYKNLKKVFTKTVEFKLEDFRTNKTKEEVDLISKACQIGDKVFNEVVKKIKVGITEKEIAKEIKLLAIRYGADDISFASTVAFNNNSAVPHHQGGDTKLAEGQIILLDFGMKVNGYSSDMTRTIFLGKPNSKQKKIYETVLGSQTEAENFIKENLVKGKMPAVLEVDKIARQFIIEAGYKSIPHSLGHGIGLEVHEHPHIGPGSKDKLEEGMVFSIEPGIYIPELGGVRIEDLYTIEENSLVELTKSPKKLISI